MPEMTPIDSWMWPPEGPFYRLQRTRYGRLVITSVDRKDPQPRVVAYVDSRDQWDKFVAVLINGGDEAAAFRTITQQISGSYGRADGRLDA